MALNVDNDDGVTYTPYGGNMVTLLPSPYVSITANPVDAGLMRLGVLEEYNLVGIYDGVHTDFSFLEAFRVSPGTLHIPGIGDKIGVVTEVSIPTTDFNAVDIVAADESKRIFNYSIKFRVVDVELASDNVKNIGFVYSFSEEDNNVLRLNIKASAEGIYSFDDAETFVNGLINIDKNDLAPIKITTNSYWALTSNKKIIDRAKFLYSIEKAFISNKNGYQDSAYTEVTSVNESHSTVSQDYKTYDFDTSIRYNESESFSTLQAKFPSLMEDITDFYIAKHGLDPCFLGRISVTKTESRNEIQLKYSLYEGSEEDFKGYFDYTASTEEDFAQGKFSIKCDGQFVSMGDITAKRTYLEKWLNSTHVAAPVSISQNLSAPNIKAAAKALILSKAFPMLDTASQSQTFKVSDLSIDYNRMTSEFKMNGSMDNEPRFTDFSKATYTIDVPKASIFIYNFMPAANIEGHCVVQKLPIRNNESLSFSINGYSSEYSKLASEAVPLAIDIKDAVRSKFFKSATPHQTLFAENFSESSGLSDLTYSIDCQVMYKGASMSYNEGQFLVTNNTPGSKRAQGRWGL